MDDIRTKTISAVEFAALSDIDNLTSDRLQALVGGHGMLTLSIYGVMDIIAEELKKGAELKMTNANAVRIPVQDLAQKCISLCLKGGCDEANAALITAVALYLSGSNAQVGIPAGNRKLGAMTRILAGNSRCGVSNIPTAKISNKISGFAAVQAIYQAMHDRTLTAITGDDLDPSLAGSALYGHGALGEDLIYPQLAANGARIGTEAMIDAYTGGGMVPHPFTCALFGAAAILEIVHPDAEVSEEIGPYGKYNTCLHAGRAAAKAAGLPEKLHIRGSNEEMDTGALIGDLGLILKDVGGPSVIGMMALDEFISIFAEGLAGSSFSICNSPLGHSGGAAVLLLKLLQYYDWDEEKAISVLVDHRTKKNVNPEMAMCGINITVRKAEQLTRGPISAMLIKATEPYRYAAIHRRCEYAYDQLKAGRTLVEVVAALEEAKLHLTERNANRLFTEAFGEPVTVKILDLHPGARRQKSKMALKYLAFDGYFKVEVTRGDKHVVLDGLQDKVLPAFAKGELNREEVAWALPIACPICEEQMLSGNHLENIIIPAAMAAVLGLHDPKEAADIACETAVITGSIPGCKGPARKVAELAQSILNVEYEPF